MAGIRAVTPADVISVSRESFDYLLQHVPGVREAMEMLLASRRRPGAGSSIAAE